MDLETIIIRLILAFILGGVLGLEREIAGKTAGLRTFALVALGAVLYTILSMHAFDNFDGIEETSYDPSRVISQVVVGIGFIGAGVILHYKDKIRGITTASALWVAAAIGVAVGCGFYIPAAATSLLALFSLRFLKNLDSYIDTRMGNEEEKAQKYED